MANQVQGTQTTFEPTTPVGTAAAGGSPDVAKMAGTPAQKAPVLDKAVKAAPKPSETLSGQQRYQGVQAVAADVSQQAKDKIGRLQGMGAYGSRMSAIMEERLAAVSQLGINQAEVDKFSADQAQRDALTSALQAYQAAPSPTTLAALSEIIGVEQSKTGLTQYYTGTEDALAAAGKLGAAPTIGELMPDQDWAQTAQDLGVDPEAIQGLSPDQLNAAVQAAIGREYSKIQALQAERSSASDARRAQIDQELAGLGAGGQALVEQQARDAAQTLADQMESGETITFRGQDFTMAQLFEDDGIEQIVRDALRDPKAMAELEADPEAAGLVAWIKTNQAALDSLTTQMQLEVEQLGTRQTEAAELLDSIPEALRDLVLPGFDATKALTPEQLQEAQQKLANDPLWQQAAKDPALLQRLTANPALYDQLQGLEPEAVNTALEQLQTIENWTPDEQVLAQTLGLEFSDPPTLNELQQLQGWDRVFSATKEAGLSPEVAGQLFEESGAKSPQELLNVMSTFRTLNGADPNLLTLLGLPPGSRWTKRDAGEVKQWAAQFRALEAKGLTADPGFTTLVANKEIADLATMRMLEANPKLLKPMLENYEERRLVAQVSGMMARGKSTAAFNTAAAKLFGGVDPARMVNLANSAQQVLKSPNLYNQAEVRQAKEFMRQTAWLDQDGDGQFTAADHKLMRQNPGRMISLLKKAFPAPRANDPNMARESYGYGDAFVDYTKTLGRLATANPFGTPLAAPPKAELKTAEPKPAPEKAKSTKTVVPRPQVVKSEIVKDYDGSNVVKVTWSDGKVTFGMERGDEAMWDEYQRQNPTPDAAKQDGKAVAKAATAGVRKWR